MSGVNTGTSHPIVGFAFHPLFITLDVTRKMSDIFYNGINGFYEDLNSQNSSDPFIETKKKCIPTNVDHFSVDERETIKKNTIYYSVIPFTIEKRDGPSFTSPQMNKLIVDDDDTLLQLILGVDPDRPCPFGLNIIQVTEYRGSNQKVVARNFEKYI